MTSQDKEKQILKNMKLLDISREEAEQLLEDDENDYIGEDGEQMQAKAKQIKRYEKSDKKRSKSTRERKVDISKAYLLDLCEKGLNDFVEKICRKNEVELSFSYQEEDYTIKLTRHRKKKDT